MRINSFAISLEGFGDEMSMPGVLRFGKRGMPGVLRFGKRENEKKAVPGFIIDCFALLYVIKCVHRSIS